MSKYDELLKVQIKVDKKLNINKLKNKALEITLKMLTGATAKELATEYNTYTTYINKIVVDECIKANSIWFACMPKEGNGNIRIPNKMDWLRENRRMFFPELPRGVSVLKNNKIRNKKIALEVLNGGKLKEVGDKYNITHIRVKQIVTKYCIDTSKVKIKSYDIDWLRANKELFN